MQRSSPLPQKGGVAQQHCLAEVDTDSYVFLDRLLALLEAKKLFQEDAQDHGIYAGAFQTNARPDENPAGPCRVDTDRIWH